MPEQFQFVVVGQGLRLSQALAQVTSTQAASQMPYIARVPSQRAVTRANAPASNETMRNRGSQCGFSTAKARTGQVPMPWTFAGTAENRNPDAGN